MCSNALTYFSRWKYGWSEPARTCEAPSVAAASCSDGVWKLAASNHMLRSTAFGEAGKAFQSS